MRDLVDGVTEFAPGLLLVHDLDASSYTGNARFSQSFFDQCAQLARPVMLMFQEMYSTRSQEGEPAGRYDVQFARSRARARGFTGPICYVVSDGWGGDRWDAYGYGFGTGEEEEGPFFFYGANGVIDSAIKGALDSKGAHLLVRGFDGLGGRMVPETWGANNLIGQSVGASPIPDTDLDHVHADYSGNNAPAPSPSEPREEDDMEIFTVDGVDYHLWLAGNGHIYYRAYHGGVPQSVLDITGLSGGVLADPNVRLTQVNVLGVPVFFGASQDGREVVLRPTPFGYLQVVQ